MNPVKAFQFTCVEDNIGLCEERKYISIFTENFNKALPMFMIEGDFILEGETELNKVLYLEEGKTLKVFEEYEDNPEKNYSVFSVEIEGVIL